MTFAEMLIGSDYAPIKYYIGGMSLHLFMWSVGPTSVISCHFIGRPFADIPMRVATFQSKYPRLPPFKSEYGDHIGPGCYSPEKVGGFTVRSSRTLLRRQSGCA